MVNLTICIPTYNRVAELRVALKSIEEAFGSSVTVAVADNASTDETRTLCETYRNQKVFRDLNYFRWEKNEGPDRNYLKAVELAKTEYCMLMGSDDAILPNAPRLLRKHLETNVDIALFARVMYDRALSKPRYRETFWRTPGSIRRILALEKDYADYFSDCTSLAAVFSYLSVIVFRRSIWTHNQRVETFVGSAYVHAAALFEGMRRRGKTCLLSTDQPIVKCRTRNDSFLQAGHLQRFLIDWDGYEGLAKNYFPENPEILTKVLTHQANLRSLIALRYHLHCERKSQDIKYVSTRLALSNWAVDARRYWRIGGLIPFRLISALVAITRLVR